MRIVFGVVLLTTISGCFYFMFTYFKNELREIRELKLKNLEMAFRDTLDITRFRLRGVQPFARIRSNTYARQGLAWQQDTLSNGFITIQYHLVTHPIIREGLEFECGSQKIRISFERGEITSLLCNGCKIALPKNHEIRQLATQLLTTVYAADADLITV